MGSYSRDDDGVGW